MNYKKLALLAIAPILLFSIFMLVPFLSDLILAKTHYTIPKDMYASCTGVPFEAECPDLHCISKGIEKRVFDMWQKRFMEIHGISQRYFDDHIKINDVVYRDGENVWVTITYVYVNDWLKSRQSESIHLSSLNGFTTIDALTDANIDTLVTSAIEDSEQFGIPIISLDKLAKTLDKKYNGYAFDYDFCHIDFANVTGILTLSGATIIDQENNLCAEASVNLHTGELETANDLCVIYD